MIKYSNTSKELRLYESYDKHILVKLKTITRLNNTIGYMLHDILNNETCAEGFYPENFPQKRRDEFLGICEVFRTNTTLKILALLDGYVSDSSLDAEQKWQNLLLRLTS